MYCHGCKLADCFQSCVYLLKLFNYTTTASQIFILSLEATTVSLKMRFILELLLRELTAGTIVLG